MRDENLSQRGEGNGFQTPAFDRLLPRRVSIRAKKIFPKIYGDFFFWNIQPISQESELAGFFFLELWGDYVTICIVPRQGSHLVK